MNAIEKIVDELRTSEARLQTEERLRSIRDSGFQDLRDYPHVAMDLNQAKRFSQAANRSISPTRFPDDSEFFDLVEYVMNDWDDVEPLFGGAVGEAGYIDTLYFVYEGVRRPSKFEEYAVIHFKHVLHPDDDNKGVDPETDSRVTLDKGWSRSVENDDNLLTFADAVQFDEYPGHGKTLRIWWDD